MIAAFLLTAATYAQSLTIATPIHMEVEGDITPGSTLTVKLTGVVPGERVYLTTSTQLGRSCPSVVAPSCLDLDSPRIVAQGVPNEDFVVSELIVPSGTRTRYLQAISASGVSGVITLEPEPIVTITVGTPSLNVTGAAATCAPDAADLIVEFIGGEAAVHAVGFLDGTEVATQNLVLDEPLPGAVFFYATASGVEAPSCDDVTWMFEVDNSSDVACAVQGIDAESLMDQGLVPAHCNRL